MRGVRRLSSNPRSIVFLAAPGTQILDVAGPYQVFVRAAELFVEERPGVCPYRVSLASTTSSPMVRTNCGLWLRGQSSFRKIKTRIDTLLVAGGSGLDEAARDKDLLRWLRSQATT